MHPITHAAAPAEAEAVGHLRRLVRSGVAGAALLFASVALLWTLAVPLFAPADERAHVDYGMQLTEGGIPLAGEGFDAHFPQLGQRSDVQHVSNHPPLYYVLSGPVERLGFETGHPRVGLYATRALGVVMATAAVLVVGLVAGQVARCTSARTRARVVVSATAVAATVPALVAASGSIQNDSVAVLVGTLTLLSLATAARTRVTWRTVAVLGLLGALGMLSRITFLPLALAAVGAVVVLSIWPRMEPRRPGRSDVLRALARGAVVAAVTALGSGWFVALNLARYGDITGGSAVYPNVSHRELAPGAEAGPLLYLLRPSTWWTQLKQLTGVSAAAVHDAPAVNVVLAAALLGVLVGTAVLAVVRWSRGQRLLDPVGRWSVAGLGLVAAAACLQLAVHVSNRGSDNNRYLLDGLTAWSVALALATVAAGRLAPYLLTVVAAIGATGGVLFTVEMVRRRAPLSQEGWFDALRHSMGAQGFPAPTLLLLALLGSALLGLWLVARSLTRLSGPVAAPAGQHRAPL